MPEFDWAGASGRAWLAGADRLEAQLAPVTDVLLDRAALAPGESVLDVGCGRGSTTRAAAAAVGTGRVIGLDIADELVDAARGLDPDGRCEWVVADAQAAALDGLGVDVVLSRFGVMFFRDPLLAFVNLAGAVRPGGRLCVAAWQNRDRSPFQAVPIAAATAAAAEMGLQPPVGPSDGGAFSLGDAGRVKDLLTMAGWSDVGHEPLTVTLHAGGPGASPAEAAALFGAIGPFGEWLRAIDSGSAGRIVSAMETALIPFHGPTGVVIDGAIAIVTARR